MIMAKLTPHIAQAHCSVHSPKQVLIPVIIDLLYSWYTNLFGPVYIAYAWHIECLIGMIVVDIIRTMHMLPILLIISLLIV